jgi:AcrR family transcriptional regulator
LARATALALAKEVGPEKVTMEGIASRSGIAKTTLYRRWSGAPHLIMDAFLADVQPLIAYRAGKTASQIMAYALSDLAVALDTERRRLLCHLIGAAQSNSELRRAFWENWIHPRRIEGLQAMEAAGLAHNKGGAILDLLFGAFYYRMLIPYAPIDEAWIEEIVAQVFHGI